MKYNITCIKEFIVKILCYYLALLTWFSIILMFLSVIFIPLYAFLKNETKWYDKPFGEAWLLGNRYSNYKWEKYYKEIKQ